MPDKGTVKIRVKNLPSVPVSVFADSLDDITASEGMRPFTILFIKPFQNSGFSVHGPALGILTLAAILRERFGERVKVRFRDMKLYHERPEAVEAYIRAYQPDVVAVSALNAEASASFAIARIAKAIDPGILTVLGGPFAFRQTDRIFRESVFDWVFEGAADRSFPAALARLFSDKPLEADIPGFNYRSEQNPVVENHQQDLISDLDSLPFPAWDLHDFERLRKRDRRGIITNLHERPYAYLFTSRGCPYLCNYCHDIFTKRFVYQSDERVLSDIQRLYEDYGIEEFHFIDDIFNLHKPRVRSIMAKITQRWGNRLKLAFPNGLRGDILDQATIDAMVDGGTYHATISIETVTPRLQRLIEKDLDIDKAKWAIHAFARRNVIVHGAFMYGFPTETREEIRATIRYAIMSPLLHAHFFAVVPQTETPIYTLALAEASEATRNIAQAESGGGDFIGFSTWYEMAYGYALRRRLIIAITQFHFYPPRLLKFLRAYGYRAITLGFTDFVISQTATIKKLMRHMARTGQKPQKPEPPKPKLKPL